MLTVYANGEASQVVEVAQAGKYRVRVRAAGDQAGSEPVRMSLRVDEREPKVFEIAATRKSPQVLEETVELPSGAHRIAAGFLNDYFNPEAKPTARDRNLILDYIEVLGPVDVRPPEPPESHRRLLVATPGL